MRTTRLSAFVVPCKIMAVASWFLMTAFAPNALGACPGDPCVKYEQTDDDAIAIQGLSSGYGGYGVLAQDTGGSQVGNGLQAYSYTGQGVYSQGVNNIALYGLAGNPMVPPSAPTGLFGAYLYATGTGAIGVYGSSDGGDAGHFTTSHPASSGVAAENTGTNGTGLFALATGSTSSGVSANSDTGNGLYAGSAGTGMRGAAAYLNNTGEGYGLWAQSSSGEAAYFTSPHDGVEAHAGTGGASTYTALQGINDGNGLGIYGQTDSSTTYPAIKGKNTGSYYGGFFDSTSGAGLYATGGGTYAAVFNGNIEVSGSTCSCSDRRLKKNISPLDGALDSLLKLKGVTFEWKDPKEHANQTGIIRGFIAQDVETVFPDWVQTDAGGIKSVSVTQIEALEVESIRALKQRNDALEVRLADLENGRHPIAASALPAGFNPNNLGWMGLGALGMYIGSLKRRSKREHGL